MKASKTEVPVWEIDELEVGDYKPNVEFNDIESPPPRAEKCVVFDDGDPSELVGELVSTLKEKGLNLGAYK
jgi:electron transfer flavoprotein alpha/beta subunit